jgi:hypothetical protein
VRFIGGGRGMWGSFLCSWIMSFDPPALVSVRKYFSCFVMWIRSLERFSCDEMGFF